MMSLQTVLRSLYEPFLTLPCSVSHYARFGDPPFVVWTEDGEDGAFAADNHKEEQQLTGVVDFFTQTEFDPIADEIQEILNAESVGWQLSSVQYETGTKLIHYTWRWWIG